MNDLVDDIYVVQIKQQEINNSTRRGFVAQIYIVSFTVEWPYTKNTPDNVIYVNLDGDFQNHTTGQYSSYATSVQMKTLDETLTMLVYRLEGMTE